MRTPSWEKTLKMIERETVPAEAMDSLTIKFPREMINDIDKIATNRSAYIRGAVSNALKNDLYNDAVEGVEVADAITSIL